MDSWWQLGEGGGNFGQALNVDRIACPFCMEKGNFSLFSHAEKKKANSEKKLNFDTLQCGNCGGYVMVLWSASSCLINNTPYHAYRVLPWPLKFDSYPDFCPEAIGRFWLQAKRNVRDENWDAAAMMARSALQGALRRHGAQGRNLKQEIDDLAAKGILPPIMQDWSNHVRELGNDSAHPDSAHGGPDPQDVRDIVEFLDFLLKYLYNLPHQIEEYRKRATIQRQSG